MNTFTMPDIVCDVDLPRNATATCIPMAWVRDEAVSLSAQGFIYHVASYPAGTVVSGVELSRGRRPGQSARKILDSLVEAGYLLPVEGFEGRRYRLVHPDRLGPLPTV